MPSIYDIKPKFQNLLRPLVKKIAQVGITANQVTVTTFLFSFLVGGLIVFFHENEKILFIVPITMIVRMALNAIDGMLAKEFNMKTPLGAILNELGDVFSDIALYLPFALIRGVNSVAIVFVVLLATISEMTGVIAIQIGAERKYNGPMGKSDRAFVFSVIAISLGLGLFTELTYTIILGVIIILLLLTITNRVKSALKGGK